MWYIEVYNIERNDFMGLKNAFIEGAKNAVYLSTMRALSVVLGIIAAIGIILLVISSVFLKEAGYVLTDVSVLLIMCMIIFILCTLVPIIVYSDKFFVIQLILSLIGFTIFMLFFKHSILASILTYVIAEIILGILSFFAMIVKY